MDINYWINTKDYATAPLIWNGVGCLFWVVTYAVLLYEIKTRKFVEMPFFIAAGNIAWELVWSIFFHPNTGRLYSLSYQGAFLLDIFIFISILKYGYKQINIPEIQERFKMIAIVLFLLWVPLNYYYVLQGFDTPIGANSGYILNLIISLLYPILLLRSDVRNFSMRVAWCKGLGTACISVSMFMIYPKNYFVQCLCVACFLFDAAYVYLLKQRQKALPLTAEADAIQTSQLKTV